MYANMRSASRQVARSQIIRKATPDEIIAQRIANARQYSQYHKKGAASEPSTVEPSSPSPLLPDYGANTPYLQGKKGDGMEDGVSDPVAPPPLNSVSKGEKLAEQALKELKAIPFLEREGVEDLAGLIQNARQEPERGSATFISPALQGVFSVEASQMTAGLDTSLSMEAFTVAREDRVKAKGAEVLTSQVDVDQVMTPRRQAALDIASQSTDLSNETLMSELGRSLLSSKPFERADSSPTTNTPSSSDQPTTSTSPKEPELYQPSVSTWGAFPRPANINEAYGGGKNIRPGQLLETKEQEADRERSFKLAMQQYKTKMGLDIDPELEAEADREYSEGMIRFEAGQLEAAYKYFIRALDLVPVRTAVGGKATLQKAVILDSTGNSEEAKKLYKNLRGHAVAAVARKARTLSYGFEAADFLKADTISYVAKNKDYIKYFRSIADRNRVFVASAESKAMDEQLAKISTIVAVGVIAGPLILVGSIIATKQ